MEVIDAVKRIKEYIRDIEQIKKKFKDFTTK